jgi:tetratricopeptide (TPR) repeat protein
MNRRYTISPAILIALFLTAATLSTYWPVQKYDFVNFDDDEYVFDNPHVKTGLTLKNIVWAFTKSHSANWHPLTWISHMVDCELFGLNAGGHHLMNLYIHLANVLLLFFLLKKMTAATWRSAFVAALFALHPLHVESVAWIAERKDVLCTFFFLLTIWAYSDYIQQPRPGSYLRVMFWFVMGLMSKPMVVTLPLVLLVMDFWPLKRTGFGRSVQGNGLFLKVKETVSPFRNVVLEKVPLVLLSLASCIITIIVQKNESAIDRTPFTIRVLHAIISYVQYLATMFFPFHLSVYYPYPAVTHFWQAFAALCLLLLITIAALRQKKDHPWFISGWLWFLVTLIPVIGLLQVGNQARADRYTYIPLIGLFIIISWGGAGSIKKMPFLKVPVIVTALAIVLALSALSRCQLQYWQNGLTLFSRTLNVTKENALAHINFGAALFNLQGNADSSLAHFKESIRIHPNYLDKYDQGIIFGKTNRLDKAVTSLSEAIQFDSTHAEAYFSLGEAYKLMGNDTAAVKQLTKAIALKPDYWEAIHCLGIVMYARDSLDKALSYFNKELAINPGTWQACHYLGLIYNKKRDFQRAFIYLTKAIELCRDSSCAPTIDLGDLLFKNGKLNSAKVLFTHAIHVAPQSPESYYNRAAIYFLQQCLDSAIGDYSMAIRLKPGWKKAHDHLAKAYKARGMPDSADVHFKKSL